MGSKPVITIRLPEGWIRACARAFSLAIGVWLVTVTFAVTIYLVEADSPWLVGKKWVDAAAVGIDFWALCHGGSFAFAGGKLSLIPLGMPLLLVVLSGLSVRHLKLSAALFFPAVYALTCAIVAAISQSPSGGAVFLGALIITGVTTILTQWNSLPLPPLRRVAGKTGFIAAMSMVGVGGIALLFSLASNWTKATNLFQLLGAGRFGGFAVVILCLLYLPNACIYAFAWVCGSGFHLGLTFSPFAAPHTPTPAFPLFGLLPTASPGWTVILIPVAVVLVIGIIVGYRRNLDVARQGAFALEAGVCAWLILVMLALASKGNLGAGRLVGVGIPIQTFTWVTLLEIMCALAIALFFSGKTVFALVLSSLGLALAYPTKKVGMLKTGGTGDAGGTGGVGSATADDEGEKAGKRVTGSIAAGRITGSTGTAGGTGTGSISKMARTEVAGGPLPRHPREQEELAPRTGEVQAVTGSTRTATGSMRTATGSIYTSTIPNTGSIPRARSGQMPMGVQKTLAGADPDLIPTRPTYQIVIPELPETDAMPSTPVPIVRPKMPRKKRK
ncbi:MAG: DUF6350 family protein [Actinomycetaceae bacterium]|nr:DUF6350 family protein [Actinomycetaceae bacterium]